MKIAVVGAGFVGLAIIWHLLKQNVDEIVLFDKNGIGGGASGIAAGLLHPYGGLHAKLNWFGVEGYQASRHLIEVASASLGRPVADFSGALRLALNESQLQDYKICSEKYNDVTWLEALECQKKVVNIPPAPGIVIQSAITVYPDLYLKGLWQSFDCSKVSFVKNSVNSLRSLEHFDQVIVAAGMEAIKLPELSDLAITPVKGQILEFEWPKDLSPLSIPLNSQAYIVMDPSKKSCLVGTTYERDFQNEDADLERALAEIGPKAFSLFPPLAKAKILSCRAGVRASTRDHKPLLKQLDQRTWVLTGMGSKGLLYHALFAKMLVSKMFNLSL